MTNPEIETRAIDDEVVLPALLRWARGSYAQAVSAQLAAAGFDDLPRNGSFVLGGMVRENASAADMIHGLGVSKQAASQLIDTLVIRGYLTREIDARSRGGPGDPSRGRLDRCRTRRHDHAGATRRDESRSHGSRSDQDTLGSLTSTRSRRMMSRPIVNGGQRGTRTLDLADVNRAL
jgi:hypothetical protein